MGCSSHMNEQDFARWVTTKSNLRSANSRRHCFSRYRIFVNWLKENHKEITKTSLEEFLYQLAKKHPNHNTLNTYINVLLQLKIYFKDRGIKTNAFDGIHSYPKYRPPIIILSHEEVETIIYADTRKTSRGDKLDALLFMNQTLRMFLAYTGCRFEESVLLKVKYIDLPNGKIIIPADIVKNKQSRTLFITEPLISRLRKLIKDKSENDLIFTNTRGKKTHAQEFGDDLRLAAKRCGITKRVHAHLFRHTYGTYLYMATEDIGLVQVVLGHKDIKSTMIYIHIASEFIRRGMYRHPFVRNQVDPKEFISAIEHVIASFKLDKDPRFDYLSVKNAINDFSTRLYKSLRINKSLHKIPSNYRQNTVDIIENKLVDYIGIQNNYYNQIGNEIVELEKINNIDGKFENIKKYMSQIASKLMTLQTVKLNNLRLDKKRIIIDIINING